MSIALLQAGVSLRREERQEQAERPSRIAAIFAQMKAPTRDKLGEAYQKQYGISLADEAIQEALRTARIKIIAPRRKPDLDEVAARPERLRELISQHPELNYDQLGRKYEERYGVRLSSSLVGLTLNRLGIHRIRVVDSNELSERPGRLRALAERYPDLEYAEVAQEYERLYQTSLHPATVQRTLNQLGLHRIRRTDCAFHPS